MWFIFFRVKEKRRIKIGGEKEMELENEKYTYAVVTKVTLEEIQDMKHFFDANKIDIVFQKTSPLRLFIKEGSP